MKKSPPRPRVDLIRIEWSGVNSSSYALVCRAVAMVSYPIGTHGDRRLEWLTSGGLSGIDPRSTPDYFAEIESEQLDELADHLRHFHVTFQLANVPITGRKV